MCLGFCHSSPAYRDGTVVDAGPGALERVASGAAEQAAEPEGRTMLDEPVLLGTGTFAGLRRALSELSPEELLEEVTEANLRGRGGAGFPAGKKWSFAADAEGDEKLIVVNGDEGDPGSYIDKHLMEQCPRLLLEGMALAGYAVGSEHGLILVRSEYPDSTPVLREAIEKAYAEGELGDDIHGSGFSFHVQVEEGAGSYVVGEETALLGSLQGLRGTVNARPPFPAQRGWHGKPTVVNNVETLCNAPYIAANGAEAYKALSPDATPGVKLVCLNERFVNPGIFEVPFGTPVSHICNELGGGLKDGKADQGGADRRAARRRAAAAGCWTRRWTSTTWPSTAAWSATARSWPSTRTPTSASCAPTCWSSAPTRAAASASRAGSACSARSRCPRRRATSTARSSRRCWRRWSWGRCAPTAAACRRPSGR